MGKSVLTPKENLLGMPGKPPCFGAVAPLGVGGKGIRVKIPKPVSWGTSVSAERGYEAVDDDGSPG